MVHVDDYDFGEIIVDGESYTEDLVLYPDHVEEGWWRKEGHSLHVEDLEDILEDPPNVLIIGKGAYGRLRVLPETRRALEGKEIEIEDQKTRKATNLFNKMVAEDKDVVAALHLTC